ncbi:MAG: hypothetical protein JNK17_03265 [Hydrogenophaga sp.]|uniref:DUF3024 domain-containing protein n=1 Tax=Hydrogenophaga sp. TaxID=1904254 RepID=UPI001A4C5FE3|nr:hypothetical protein [Hydrogenophaga sp.]
MNAAAVRQPPDTAAAQVVGFMQPFIERALKDRARYRYVQPRVLPEGDAFRIEAPCCSRNVDKEGGVIDIALLRPVPDGSWQVYARNHPMGIWELQARGLTLGDALETVCIDADRIFWP